MSGVEQVTRRRAFFIAGMFAVLAAAVLYKLIDIQIFKQERYAVRAEDQQRKMTREVPRRGSIYDRNGHELALSIEEHRLLVYPSRVDNVEAVAEDLSPILDLPPERIARRIRRAGNRKPIAEKLTPVQARQIRGLDIFGIGPPAFELEAESRRSYPGGVLAAHVIGFAGKENSVEVGREGIEKALDDLLQGAPNRYYEVKDRRGGGFIQQAVPNDDPHQDVYLTLDAVLQHTVERELSRVVREQHARAASAVLIDPATGKILAMAGRPTVDLSKDWGRSREDARGNRAIRQDYDPGSTFKIFTAAALLDQGLVRPNDRFHCENGSYRVQDSTYHDHKRFGRLTFREVLENSSNIGTIKASSVLDGDRFLDYLGNLGFGHKTGILFPGEVAGRMPDLRRSPTVGKASLSIGYGITTTVLQLASAVAAVANGGVLVPPTLVEGTRTADGHWRARKATEPRRVMQAETARTLTGMLESVVRRGTGVNARVSGYRIAGKTGTSKKHIENLGYSDELYYASFAGFGPVRDPRLALVVMVDSPRKDSIYGGEIAAPVFRRIMSEAFRHLRIPPDQDSMVMTAPGPSGAVPASRPANGSRP